MMLQDVIWRNMCVRVCFV